MTGTPAHSPQREAEATGQLAGRPVRRVGYGVMQLAGHGGQPGPDRDAAVTVLRRAVELGVNHLDTAGFYGDGVANDLIRAALHPYPDDLLLVSKVGAELDPHAGLVAAQRPRQLRASVEANLRQLGTGQLAAVNLRRLDNALGIQATGDQLVDLDSQLAELTALRDEGKIGGVGLSNVSLDQLRQASPAGIVCVQNHYNLLDRSGEPLLAECARRNIAWVPFFPLGSAFAARAKVAAHPAVTEVAGRLGVAPAQVGLAWLLAHDPRVLLIPGTASLEHLEQNVAAGHLRLDAAAIASLDAITP
jgi:pyridoxine 4-dehydrogenase